MVLLDNSKNCDIITSSFTEDLLGYTVQDNNIVWSDNSSTPYITKINLFTDETQNEITYWQPNFVSDDDQIANKIISHYGSMLGDSQFDSGRIGIEDFFSFEPKFKNWTVNNAAMTIDWILNRANISYSVVAGLNYWSKNGVPVTGLLENFPVYSKLKYNNIEYIKLDDETLRRINPNPVTQNIFTSNSLSHSYSGNEEDTLLSTLGNNVIFTLVGSDDKKIWIPDGDQILYYLNQADQNNRLTRSIGPQSYISGSLYKYYNVIYNAITCNEIIQDIKEPRSLKKLRLYKKLAHSLATSPFVSEFFINFLANQSDNIKKAIESYINSNSDSIDNDINNLKNVLQAISIEYSEYEIVNNSNIVINNDQLFTKLINKYGAKLRLTNNGSISYNNRLKHGDSIIIEEIGNYLVDKNFRDKNITNNKIIRLNKLSIETNISEINSNISLKTNNEITNTVHLYDSIKPDILQASNINIALEKNNNVGPSLRNEPSSIPEKANFDPSNSVFYFSIGNVSDNRDGWVRDCPRVKATNLLLDKKYIDSRFPLQSENLVEQEFSYVWERVSGPVLKFIDIDKIDTNKKYDRAYGNEVILVPSSTGKYVIRCTISGPFGSYTKIKTIFIVDGREKIIRFFGGFPSTSDNAQNFNTYLNPDSNTLDNVFVDSIEGTSRILLTPNELNKYTNENVKIFLNKDNLKIFSCGLDALAIHRNGLFAPIRSNYIVEKVLGNSRPIEKLQNNSYKFIFDEIGTIDPVTSNSNFSIIYNSPESIIKLERIILKNLRNNDPECSQCFSIYDPKLRSFISSVNRRPRFLRSNKFPDNFTLQRYIFDQPTDSHQRFSFVDYKYPQISTDLSPPIKPYGGYGNKVLNKIQIEKIEGLDKPANINLNSGLVSSVTNPIPSVTGYRLDEKTDYSAFDDRVRGYKFCYEKNVIPSGYISFKKGSFIPSSGWLINDNTNLSSVLKFNPGARKSFNFAGPGILGLKNYTPEDSINLNTFSSSINLTINPSIRWDPGPAIEGERCLPDEDEPRREALAQAKGIHFFQSQLNKELVDQYSGGPNPYDHHGYRILNQGRPKASQRNIFADATPVNDEFDFSISEQNNQFNYGFTTVGYHSPINVDDDKKRFVEAYLGNNPDQAQDIRDYIENNNDLGLVNPRINSLTIKDIEVQLNFLNYVNTKNLVVWLEVDFSSSEKRIMSPQTQGQTRTIGRQITSENLFVDQFVGSDTYKQFDSSFGRSNFTTSDTINVKNNSVNKFLEDITNFNSLDVPEKLKIYLLNQETVQNKEYNFSIKFSDTANKNNVLFDYNLFSFGKVNGNQNIINNNMSIRPTTNIFGYDTKQNCYNHSIIVDNNLNINNNTFNKFADKKLFQGVHPVSRCVPKYGPYDSSTTFTLHIALLDEEDEMIPIDNLISNEIYSNIASVENKITSANLFNNLCSWELILHTEDVKKPITSQVNSLANYGGTDSLSLIEYGESPKYPGYGFIADLSDEKFLLPLVNMNAPTTFFQNYNACEYADNELIGKGTIISGPRFPTEAIVLILAGTAVGGMTGTLVGVLVGGLGPTYNQGFQLIYDYFRESRQVPVLENVQRETFDTEYDSYPMGNSDKILVNVSKDGLFWYKLEASIFKLSNTPALPLKSYKFLKGDNKLFKFNFDIITNNSDIIDEIFFSDIINRATPEEVSEEEQELYLDIDSSVYENFDFMSVDKLISFNKLIHSKNIFESKRAGDLLIIIDHTLPYYTISIKDKIEVICSEDESVFSEVTSKALVYKNNKYQTILALDNKNLNACSEIYLPDDVIVIYNDETTKENSGESPISLFGLVNDQPPNDTVPEVNFSTNSLGSYGDGSIVKDKNILSRKVKINNIEPIYTTLNSFNNDKYYFNEIELNFQNQQRIIKDKIQAYPIYYDVNYDTIISDSSSPYFVVGSSTDDSILENIENLLSNSNTEQKDYKSYLKDKKYNMMYLKINNDFIKELDRNSFGSLTIENNYTYNETVERITQDQLTTLTNRLNTLNKTKDNTIESILGNINNTSRILATNSIYYIQQHYDILNNDPDAYDARNRTYNILQKLYKEKSEILQLLNNQTIKKAKIFKTQEDFENEPQKFVEEYIEFDNFTQIKLKNNPILDKEDLYQIDYLYELDNEKQKYHLGDEGIIPDYRANISVLNNRSINIEYEKISDNYYWINIDPKQACSIAEERRPKVLKSIKYVCNSINPVFSAVGAGSEISDFNSVCPDWLDVNGVTGGTVDFEVQADSQGTVYKTKQEIIDKTKEDLEKEGCEFGWKEKIITRRFRINSEKNIKNILSNAEFLVTVTETYDIALTQLESEQKEKNTEQLITDNIINNDLSGDPYGKLIGSTGPTRVYNIFNLDNTSELKVQFRKAPRIIRGIDAISTILRYGENNSYIPQNRPPLDPLDTWGVGRTESLINDMYEWVCFEKHPETKEVTKARLPEIFKLFNEMTFRAFFGSVDGIENKTEKLKSLYQFEMIPYEYFTKPLPPDNL